MLIDENDEVLVESPTYSGALAALGTTSFSMSKGASRYVKVSTFLLVVTVNKRLDVLLREKNIFEGSVCVTFIVNIS